MASISASTMHKVKKQGSTVSASGKSTASTGAKKSTPGAPTAATAKRGSAPPLKPATLASWSKSPLASLSVTQTEERKQAVLETFQRVLGEQFVAAHLSQPHAASTTRDRGGAAADVAILTQHWGAGFVLKTCGLLDEMQRCLFPQGIDSLLTRGGGGGDGDSTGAASGSAATGLKPSISALSLTSLDIAGDNQDNMTATTVNSGGTDTKRGKTMPPNAREGCLLLVRALCEGVGRPAEPYLVGAFLAAALDECGSSSSAIREAAEDATAALVALANPWSFSVIVAPILLQSLHSTEWRVKYTALERLEQCANSTAPQQVHKHIPTLIPAVTGQVWDTKAQVSKAARSALMAICETNPNRDIKPTIPAVVNAICKPADTTKAVSALMGTTFVVPVDASTLAILCPILARALKEKLAIHKRSACLVISNMSKLVETPSAVAPFGSLLVPELQKVANNVQFEEIRDEALNALANLTKALGDSYQTTQESAEQAQEMEDEQARVEAEQERIAKEREAQAQKEAETRRKEEEERQRFKEAMDAQRELDKIAAAQAEQARMNEEVQREQQKLSVKNASGVCQGCGLKKCKKTCMFYVK